MSGDCGTLALRMKRVLRAKPRKSVEGRPAAGLRQLNVGDIEVASDRSAQLRPFFGYYGGKWRDAIKHYPRPEHPVLVEPFAGSAGYALRHYAGRRVVLCEKDPRIYAIWHYLLHASPDEIRRIPYLGDGESVDDLKGVAPEAKLLVGLWVNRATSSPRKNPSQWMRSGIRPGSFWGPRVRETIATQVAALRKWEIHHCSYEECPYDGPATWFVDPPYQMAGKHYRCGSNEIDFEHLAAWCTSRKGLVIVCENEGADWLPFTELADVKTTRANRRSKEMLWVTRNGARKAGTGLARHRTRG